MQIIEAAGAVHQFGVSKKNALFTSLAQRACQLAETPDSIDSIQLNSIMNAFVNLREISAIRGFSGTWSRPAGLMPSQMNYEQLMKFILAIPQRPHLITHSDWEVEVYAGAVKRANQLAEDITPPQLTSLAYALAIAGNKLNVFTTQPPQAWRLIDQAIKVTSQ